MLYFDNILDNKNYALRNMELHSSIQNAPFPLSRLRLNINKTKECGLLWTMIQIWILQQRSSKLWNMFNLADKQIYRINFACVKIGSWPSGSERQNLFSSSLKVCAKFEKYIHKWFEQT